MSETFTIGWTLPKMARFDVSVFVINANGSRHTTYDLSCDQKEHGPFKVQQEPASAQETRCRVSAPFVCTSAQYLDLLNQPVTRYFHVRYSIYGISIHYCN